MSYKTIRTNNTINNKIQPITANDNSEMESIENCDPNSMLFEHKWTLGNFCSAKKNEWTPVNLISFDNVALFWAVMNNSIWLDTFTLNSKIPEFWLFKDDLVPHWDIVKKARQSTELIELKFLKPTKDAMKAIILLAVGESLRCAEDIVGIRIKPDIKFGGDIRIWITKKSSVEIIKNEILKKIGIYGKVECSAANL